MLTLNLPIREKLFNNDHIKIKIQNENIPADALKFSNKFFDLRNWAFCWMISLSIIINNQFMKINRLSVSSVDKNITE